MIVCRSQSEIEKLRRVNQLVARILAELRQVVVPGISDDRHRRAGRASGPRGGGRAGVQGVSRVSGDGLCVGQRAGGARHPVVAAAGDGDIVSIDMGAKLDGFFGDCAVTVPVGPVAPEAASCCG